MMSIVLVLYILNLINKFKNKNRQGLFSFSFRADLPERGHDPRFTLPHVFAANVEKMAMKIKEFCR